MGDTIEEINVGLIKAKTYNPQREYLERDIFGQYPPEVQSSFHKINRQDYYPITVNEPLLQRAFIDNSGLQSFVSGVMAAPSTSDQWDEFLLTTGLFNEYYKADGFFKVQVGDVGASSSGADTAKAFLRRVREFAGNLQFLSTHYNASGMPIAASPDDLELFITPEALAAIDVEALAGAFNIDKAAMPTRITVIPKEHFGFPGVQAILTTIDFFVIADSRMEMASVYNPVSLSNNTFFHHWEVVSASRFVPAILFTTEAGTAINVIKTPVTGVTGITFYNGSNVLVTDLERGLKYSIVASAITSPTGGTNDATRLELTGNNSTKTYLTQSGILFIGADESSYTVTVTAFAVDADGEFSSSITANLVGDKLILWPDPAVESDSDKDGLFEVVPAQLINVAGVVTIPTVKGVQYLKNGVNVPNGSTHTLATGTTTFTAVARAGFEIKAGSVTTWTFTV
jgi:hypothetical protein